MGRGRGRPRAALLAIVAVAAAAGAAAAAFVSGARSLVASAQQTRRAAHSTEAWEAGSASEEAAARAAAVAPPSLGRRAAVGGASLAAALVGGEQGAMAKEPKITAKCALDIRIGLDSSVKPRRMVIGLFGEEAPVLTSNFLKACSGTVPGEAGQSARYKLSTVRAISKDRLISFADFPGGNFLFRRTAPSRGGMVKEERIPLAGPDTKTEETNGLVHDAVGRVSMPKGGGTYNFLISPVANTPFLDKKNVVIGQVLEGLDLLEDINKYQTYQKGGVLNLASGTEPPKPTDPESADDYLRLPLQKIKVLQSQVLEP